MCKCCLTELHLSSNCLCEGKQLILVNWLSTLLNSESSLHSSPLCRDRTIYWLLLFECYTFWKVLYLRLLVAAFRVVKCIDYLSSVNENACSPSQSDVFKTLEISLFKGTFRVYLILICKWNNWQFISEKRLYLCFLNLL